MIQPNLHISEKKEPVKAIGLVSGGLDSALACKIVKDLGVDIHAVYFAMPWGCCDKAKAMEVSLTLGLKFITLQLDERYLEIVKKPKFGYGTALNPCVDCRIHMFKRAAQYMKHIGAEFVFTGEVIGQRPMSQLKHSMKWIEEESGLQGRLLRPLCAKLLEPTIPEQEGTVDREQLLEISGRSRKFQYELAQKLNVTTYNPPTGGCLLTDHHFAKRMKDTFKYGYRTFRETISLKWGRHYRVNNQFKIIIGRDEEENVSLIRFAHPDDHVMQLPDNLGPTVLIKGENPSDEILQTAAGMLQRFTKRKDDEPIATHVWLNKDRNSVRTILAKPIDETILEKMKI
jgi:tRNA-specific 2-thiouridylase